MKSLATALFLSLCFSTGAFAAQLPSWMSGSWAGTIDGVKMEEQWTSADGGVMLGLHRDIRANGKVSFEFLRIEQKGDAIVLLAQPGGRPATTFTATTATAEKIVFENLAHDFPQRISYWRKGDSLCARVEGVLKSDEVAEEWCWARAGHATTP